MKTRFGSALLTLLFGFTLIVPLSNGASAYSLQTEIPVGGEGGWDYLSIDPAAHRLYVSHGNSIVVIDTEKNSVAGEITDTPGVHGIALAPDLGKGFTTNGRENKMGIVDLKTLKTLSKVETG